MSLEGLLAPLNALVQYLAGAYARASAAEIAIAVVIVLCVYVAGYFVGRALGWREIDELHRSWARVRANFGRRPRN